MPFLRTVYDLVLQNVGRGPIEVVEIIVDSGLDPNMITCDTTPLKEYLPLAEDEQVRLPVTFFAVANFVNSFPPGLRNLFY